jgi:hypothetical protein
MSLGSNIIGYRDSRCFFNTNLISYIYKAFNVGLGI